MKKIGVIAIGGFLIIFGAVMYFFMSLDFVGSKDPRIVQENIKRQNDMLLSAEYRDGTDHCSIELLDSVNAIINAGNNTYSLIQPKEYVIDRDTIIFKNDIYPKEPGVLTKYVDAKKFLIKDSIVYILDTNNSPVILTPLRLRFNKLANE